MDSLKSTIVALLGVGITCMAIMTLLQYTGPKYVNLVWGRVESVRYSRESDMDNVSVIYTVLDEEYTGTYRIAIQTDDFYNVDDIVLLMTTENYSKAKFFDDATFAGGSETEECYLGASQGTEEMPVLNEVLVVGKVIILILLLITFGYSIIWLVIRLIKYIRKYTRYECKLNNCCYVVPKDISELYNSINSILQSKRKCKNRSLIKIINRVLGQMYKRLDHICRLDAITDNVTKNDTKNLISDTINTFNVIATTISEQVYAAERDVYSSEDFKRAVYQLEAYAELSKGA